MLIKQIIEVFDLLDSPMPAGKRLKLIYRARGGRYHSQDYPDGKYATDFIKIVIAGRMEGLPGTAPTMGIVGRLGAIGARPK